MLSALNDVLETLIQRSLRNESLTVDVVQSGQTLLSLLHAQPQVLSRLFMPQFAKVFVNLLKLDHSGASAKWLSAFSDLLELVTRQEQPEFQKASFAFLVRVLLTFDEEAVENIQLKKTLDLELCNRLKDFARNPMLVEPIVQMLQNALQNYTAFDSKVIRQSLRVVAQLIDW